MSVSSESEAPYNEFYDYASVSGGDSDDFIMKKSGATKKIRRKETKYTQSTLASLMAPFEGCCFQRSNSPPRSMTHLASSAQETGPLNQLIMQTSALSESNDNSETSNDDEIPVGTNVRGIKKGFPKRTKEGTDQIRDRLEKIGIHFKDLLKSQSLDQSARWIVSLPISRSIHLKIYELSQHQRDLAALLWCANVTLSQKLSERLLEKVISAALNFPGDLTIEQAFVKQEEFSTLESSRMIEARLIEEVVGEFQQLIDIENSFLIISNVRTVATLCRRQGDATLITIFDVGISRERGPAFLGFDSSKVAENYLIGLYTADPEVRRSSSRFSAWTIRSKQMFPTVSEEDAIRRGIAPKKDGKPIWEEEAAAAENNQADDPNYQAKLAYGAMYKATDAPKEEENIFSHTAAGAMNVAERKKK